MLKSKHSLWLIIPGVILIIAILLATAAYTPESANPAFAAAVRFVQAAGAGQDETALSLLSPALRNYSQEHCPQGSVAACVRSYTPPEWGAFRSVVFRRAAPEGRAWHVELIATYETGTGASGVCIYNRVEPDDTGEWHVTAWAGFIHCGEAGARSIATNPDTPHRAP